MHPFALLELIISHQYNSKALEYVRGPMPPSKYEKLLNQNWIKQNNKNIPYMDTLASASN